VAHGLLLGEASHAAEARVDIDKGRVWLGAVRDGDALTQRVHGQVGQPRVHGRREGRGVHSKKGGVLVAMALWDMVSALAQRRPAQSGPGASVGAGTGLRGPPDAPEGGKLCTKRR
jgi:hypothetical protein